MKDKDINDLFYLCSLIEFIGRKTKNKRDLVVKMLGKQELKRQLSLADVNHSLSFDEVADELISYFNINEGEFDSVTSCNYKVPTVLSIGKLYQRLIVAVKKDNEEIIDTLYNVFTSFISEEISNYNSSLYYSNPDYLRACYQANKILP